MIGWMFGVKLNDICHT